MLHNSHMSSFIPISIDRNPEVLKDHVLKSLVESLLTAEAGKPLSFAKPSKLKWPKGVQIVVDPKDSKPSISFSNSGDKERLIEQLVPLSAKDTVAESESDESVAAEPQEGESGLDTQAISSSLNSEEISDLKIPEQEPILGHNAADTSEQDAAVKTDAVKASFLIEVADSAWMRISIMDPAMKFKVRYEAVISRNFD